MLYAFIRATLQFMTEVFFMQLLLVLLTVLLGGNLNAVKEVKPILESLGGGSEIEEALNKAEEISGVINAVRAMAGAQKSEAGQSPAGEENFAQHGFPLAPIARIADENVTYCLSRYITVGD